MKNRNIHQFAELFLDDEAFGRFDILKINPAKRRPQIAHGIDELLGVFGIDFQINRINIGEALEQHRLAFHHGLGRKRAKIA